MLFITVLFLIVVTMQTVFMIIVIENNYKIYFKELKYKFLEYLDHNMFREVENLNSLPLNNPVLNIINFPVLTTIEI